VIVGDIVSDYQIEQPSPEELRILFKESGLKRREIAEALHVSGNAVEKWTLASDSQSHRRIPLGLYELLLIKLGKHSIYHK
jgi:transcriptional regulator with XRE-family HTH domain